MSNWRLVKTEVLKNVEPEFMEEAFARMGYAPDFDVKEVKGAYRSDGKHEVDAVLRDIKTGMNTEIGLVFEKKKKEGNVKMSVDSDWWGKGTNGDDFAAKFQMEYITVKNIATLRAQGFELVSEETNEREITRKLRLRRAA